MYCVGGVPTPTEAVYSTPAFVTPTFSPSRFFTDAFGERRER